MLTSERHEDLSPRADEVVNHRQRGAPGRSVCARAQHVVPPPQVVPLNQGGIRALLAVDVLDPSSQDIENLLPRVPLAAGSEAPGEDIGHGSLPDSFEAGAGGSGERIADDLHRRPLGPIFEFGSELVIAPTRRLSQGPAGRGDLAARLSLSRDKPA